MLRISLILLLFLILASACSSKNARFSEKSSSSGPVQKLSGEQISRLENGVPVRFSARLVESPEVGCLETFAGEDFTKYGGDSKFAIRSYLLATSPPSNMLKGNVDFAITGRMTFVNHPGSANQTRGIIAGQVFEITAIEPL